MVIGMWLILAVGLSVEGWLLSGALAEYQPAEKDAGYWLKLLACVLAFFLGIGLALFFVLMVLEEGGVILRGYLGSYWRFFLAGDVILTGLAFWKSLIWWKPGSSCGD